ncbi:Crp/Fnr family transcriptional regulator [Paenibacillus barcinonensis]|uniref:CRP-like cAMP-binding protein n=1 Tax=Paenibacillus barcinonensis TaxID=198119 RepID=A0A2V4WVE6_PAEBA|nr:Crp/Fnr family transcriptional regulator [Paenibacillus barcinonensis]PYE52577.1 CRP-like cAMP-binding protein [Paenibacillus barcinonensis]QKS59273.1 Crp/Fnr family transcriptional regulator [Paenibacillus barcinonensis]
MQIHYEALHRSALEAGISAEEWDWFVQGTSFKEIPRGTALIRAGESVHHAYFCTKGCFRLYYTLPDGKDFNVAFTLEQDYATSYAAMVSGAESSYTIEALEDSTVIAIPYDALLHFMEASHHWEHFVRKAVERLYIRKEERERELLCLSALERYEAFLQKYPGLEKRIPQYHIAAYIGISPVSLSRLLR